MSRHDVRLSVSGGPAERGRAREAGAFVLGVLGDFSGRSGQPGLEARLAEKVLHDVDRDSFDTLVRRLAPSVALELPFAERVTFTCWADFEPDALVERLPGLARLHEAREAVGDPERMRACLAEAGVALTDPSSAAAEETAPSPPASNADLLDSILGGEGSEAPRAAAPRSASAELDSALARLIEEIGAAAADRTDYAAQDRWRAAIDAALAERLRAVLHHPALAALEARWRALRRLVLGAETGAGLRIRVLDLGVEDLLAELRAADDDPRRTAFHRLAVEGELRTPGGSPFGLIACDYAVGADALGAALFGALSLYASLAEAPLLADAGTDLAGLGERVEPGGGEVWGALRELPGADRVALACPRLLSRLPFGEQTLPLEHFDFEELGDAEGPCLWESAALALAGAALGAVAGSGSLRGLPPVVDLPDLRVHVTPAGTAIGPTQRELSESELKRLVEHGLVPVAGIRHTDTARVPCLQSVSGTSLL